MSLGGPFKADDVAAIYAKYTRAEHDKFSPIYAALTQNQQELLKQLLPNVTTAEKPRLKSYRDDFDLIHKHPAARDEYIRRQEAERTRLVQEQEVLRTQRQGMLTQASSHMARGASVKSTAATASASSSNSNGTRSISVPGGRI